MYELSNSYYTTYIIATIVVTLLVTLPVVYYLFFASGYKNPFKKDK